jgi:hypothetical protein
MAVVYCVGKQAGCFCVELEVSFDFYDLPVGEQHDQLIGLLARAVGVHYDQVFLWQAGCFDEHRLPDCAGVFRGLVPNQPDQPNQPIQIVYFDVANQIDMTVSGSNFEASEMVRNRDVPNGLQLVNHRLVNMPNYANHANQANQANNPDLVI